LLQEDEQMTTKSTLTTFFAAVLFASTVAAHADGATIPDPNLAPSTSAAEAELPGTPANEPELASIPDPDLAPSISASEARLAGTPANEPELASIPDPNLAPSTPDEQPESHPGVLAAGSSAPSDTGDTIQQ